MDDSEESARNVDDFEWYSKPEFNHFWRTYSRTMEFCHRNLLQNQQTVYEQWCKSMVMYHTKWAEYMRQCCLYYSSQIPATYNPCWSSQKDANSAFDNDLFVRPRDPASRAASKHPQNDKHQENSSSFNKHKRKKRRNKKHKRNQPEIKKAKKGQLFSDLENMPSDFELVVELSSDADVKKKSGSEEDEYQMEISEEMLAFFAHSAKHKRERAKAQSLIDEKKEKEEVEEDHMDLAFVSAHRQNPASVLPPTERPGARRTSEMTAIYGDGAPMIHAMETALQLTYNRNCDRNQAKLWPQLPLNIKFD